MRSCRRAPFFLRELVAFHGAEHGAKEVGVEELGERASALLAEPDQDFRRHRAFADPARERGAKFLGTALLLDVLRDLGHEAGGSRLEQLEQHGDPSVAECDGKLLHGALLLRGGNRCEENREIPFLADENVRHGRRAFAGLERLVAGENFVAGEQKLQGMGGLEAAALVCRVLDLRGQGLEFVDLLREIVERLGDLFERDDLVFQVAGSAELLEQALGLRGRGVKQHDRIGFLRGKLEVAVGLELLLGSVPPFLECGGVEDLRRERCGNLVDRGLAVEITEDARKQAHGILSGFDTHGVRILHLAGEDVILRDRLEGFRGVLHLHRVALAVLEIDNDLAGQQTPLRHAAESPAFVTAKRPRGELVEDLRGLRGQFAALYCLLKFFVHLSLFVMEIGQPASEHRLPGRVKDA